MASLLYGVTAYAAHGDPPATILTKLSDLLSVETTGHFATVLCVLVDLELRQMTVASAGHLAPLLIHGGDASFVGCPVGLPIGVAALSRYQSVTVDVPGDATLLAFTDGLVERRGESLDVGLARLRAAARRDSHPSLHDLIPGVVRTLVGGTGDDDTVVLGVRW